MRQLKFLEFEFAEQTEINELRSSTSAGQLVPGPAANPRKCVPDVRSVKQSSFPWRGVVVTVVVIEVVAEVVIEVVAEVVCEVVAEVVCEVVALVV